MGLLSLFSEQRRQPAECVVELDGSEIDDMYPALVEVVVDADRGRATTATLVFESRRLEDGFWAVQDDDRFKPWVSIKIEAVFGDESEEVMRGYVKEIKHARWFENDAICNYGRNAERRPSAFSGHDVQSSAYRRSIRWR